MDRLLDTLIIWALAAGLIYLLVLLGGCATLSGGSTGCRMDDLPLEGTVVGVWGFLASPMVISNLLLVGTVVSIIAIGLGFTKLGGITAFACVSGLMLRSALSVPWLAYGSALLLLAGVILVIVGIVRKNGALKDLIEGIQHVKTEPHVILEGDVPIVNDVGVNNTLKKYQSKATRRLVQEVKTQLKLQEKI